MCWPQLAPKTCSVWPLSTLETQTYRRFRLRSCGLPPKESPQSPTKDDEDEGHRAVKCESVHPKKCSNSWLFGNNGKRYFCLGKKACWFSRNEKWNDADKKTVPDVASLKGIPKGFVPNTRTWSFQAEHQQEKDHSPKCSRQVQMPPPMAKDKLQEESGPTKSKPHVEKRNDPSEK